LFCRSINLDLCFVNDNRGTGRPCSGDPFSS
jgi:hypothetical protein